MPYGLSKSSPQEPSSWLHVWPQPALCCDGILAGLQGEYHGLVNLGACEWEWGWWQVLVPSVLLSELVCCYHLYHCHNSQKNLCTLAHFALMPIRLVVLHLKVEPLLDPSV